MTWPFTILVQLAKMASSNQQSFPESPHSSNGGNSTYGTPDTRITAFTPDGPSARAAHEKEGMPRFHATGLSSAARNATTDISIDPFYSGANVNGARSGRSSVLRATTPAFTPSGRHPAIVNGSTQNPARHAAALKVLEDVIQASATTWPSLPPDEDMMVAQSRQYSFDQHVSRVIKITCANESHCTFVLQNCEAVCICHIT